MASYFGEVVHPSSRAFWNDDEDYDIIDGSQDNVEFVLNWIDEEPSLIKKFVVVEGEMMTDFMVNSVFESSTRCVCTINYETSKIYAVGDVYVCVISSKLSLALAGQLVSTMIPLLKKSEKIVLLSAEHESQHKSEEENDSVSFLKTLCSQKARLDKNLNTSPLNQPNIIAGVCSGALTYAEIANLHCIMYILYTDTFTLDSKNTLPLKKLFVETFGSSFSKFTSEDTRCFNKGNLYM